MKYSKNILIKWKKLHASNPDKSFWIIMGMVHGYPLCCVQEFITDFCEFTKKNYPNLPSNGTGYVPCRACAPKVQKDWDRFQRRFSHTRLIAEKFPSDFPDSEIPIWESKVIDILSKG